MLIEEEVEVSFAVLSVLLIMLVLKMRLYSNAIDLSGEDLSIIQILCLFMCSFVCEKLR